MADSSPLAYSARDLAQLRETLLRGDDAAKRAALAEVAAIGPQARPLLQVICEQWRRGLRTPSSVVVDLLQAMPDNDLHAAALDAGLLAQAGFYEKCRLFVLGFGSFEDEICTYVYRHWSNMTDPMVSEAIKALELMGTSEAGDALAAIVPELSELSNAAKLANPASIAGSYDEAESPRAMLTGIEARVAVARLDLVHSAISAIARRADAGA